MAALALAWVSAAACHGMPDDEQILARVDVPNTVLKQGEVRVVRRGPSIVVQTVLHTRFEQRVLARITRNEQQNWGTNNDAAACLADLGDAVAAYRRRIDQGARSLALVIDFVDDGDCARVELGFSRISDDGQGYGIRPGRAWRSRELSREYVLRDQEFIVADAFGKRASGLLAGLRTSRRGESEYADE